MDKSEPIKKVQIDIIKSEIERNRQLAFQTKIRYRVQQKLHPEDEATLENIKGTMQEYLGAMEYLQQMIAELEAMEEAEEV